MIADIGTTSPSSALHVNGTITANAIAGLANSIGTNGYQTLPGVIIIQWGNSSSCGTGCSSNVTFPIAFPANVFSVVVTLSNGTSPINNASNITSKSATAFTVDTNPGASAKSGFSWIAIGN